MEKEEIIEKCQSDMQACLVEMGNQQELLTKIRETGFYDSFVLLEAMNKIAELGGKLNDIQCQLKDLSAAAEKK